jgi:hypothetical protein
MPIGRTFGGHEVGATCLPQLGIDPMTSASSSQDFDGVNSIATTPSDLVFARQVTVCQEAANNLEYQAS